jgi:HEAT repeat protein
MGSSGKFIAGLSLVLWGATSVSQQVPDGPKLIVELNRPKTTDRAAREIWRIATKNTEVRQYIVERLPGLIEQQKADETWLNAVRLAGQLKATEAIPALEKALDRGPLGAPMNTTFGTEMHLQDDAVAKALSQIGDPAIPAIAGRLENADSKMRRRVVLILTNIGSPDAHKVLKDRLPHESDPKVKYLIESALHS